MNEITFKPIIDHDSYSEGVQNELDWYIWDVVFRPVMEALNEEDGLFNSKERTNASAQLKKAFATGKLQYRDGYVYGSFNAAISKSLRAAGAKWVSSKKGFKIDLKSMPTDLKIAVGAGMEKATRTLKAVQKRLDEIERARESIDTFNLKFEEKLAPVFADLDLQFVKTTSKDLEVRPELNPGQRKQLTEEYTKDLNRYIKEYTKEAVVKLRKRVEEHVTQGFRAESLEKVIKDQYGIEKRRAKFLARQETSLLVSKFREVRYKEVGLTRYKWSTSHDSRVREDHKLLNNKIFNWNEPPITDRTTGQRNHPGQDFGCRCVAIPVMRNR